MAATTHRHWPGTLIADGRLELLSTLGLGAYGVVYLARGVQRPQYYAVKCLNKVGLDQRQRAFQLREIFVHTMMSNHPNVVRLHGVLDHPGDASVYVVLEYCPDGDLFEMITEKQRYYLPPEPYVADPRASDGRPIPEHPSYTRARAEMDALIKDVFDQILSAVEYFHRVGVYHRDLKPENILCSDGGRRVKVADFGLATSDRMSSDFGCGSSFYMSPECQGGITTRLTEYSTAANDVWSLGIILINLICGRNPWKQATWQDDTFRQYLRDPDLLAKILPISDAVHGILRRIFTLSPETRCSVSDLRRWIRAVPRLQGSNEELWRRYHFFDTPDSPDASVDAVLSGLSLHDASSSSPEASTPASPLAPSPPPPPPPPWSACSLCCHTRDARALAI